MKPRDPNCGGRKVERSHCHLILNVLPTPNTRVTPGVGAPLRFYQLLTYTGDVDLNAKLNEWENFYNYHRPHGAFHGKTPYEALRDKLA